MPEHLVMRIEGMTCEHCEKTVAEALTAAGARRVVVSWPDGTAEFDATSRDNLAVRSAVEAAGYRVASIGVAAPVARGVTAIVGDKTQDFDLVVLGSGSAAFAAAITATEAGARVALVESGAIGGTCVNVGCVPSKAMLAPAELGWRSAHPQFPGLTPASGTADLRALVDAKDQLVEALRKGKYLDLAASYGFTVCRGRAEFVDGETIACDGERLRAGAYVVATGASPWVPPIEGLAEAGYVTSTTALELRNVPRRLVVIGANAIGLEMGQFFGHLGSQTTFLEAMPRITPLEEPETSDALSDMLRGEGAAVHTAVRIARVTRDGAVRHVTYEHDGSTHVIEADEILVATGRRPNTADLALDRAVIAVDARGALQVDEQLRTTNPRVWAAGDVTGHPQFVYVASHEGSTAARNALLGVGESVDFLALPRVIFTSPAFAGAGLTQEQAAARGIDIESRVLPMSAVPRALVNRDTRGFVKVVAERESGRIVGVSMVADGAGDVIQAAVYAIQFGLTTTQVASTWSPYLTFAEGLRLAAQTFTRDVAKLSCCAA